MMASTPQPPPFGATPWGKEWLRRVEPITATRPNPMLPRARSLARSESVIVDTNTIGSIRCVVSAGKKIETATFAVPRYSAAHKRTALRIVTGHPTHGRGSGDLPDALHAELVLRGLAPVPTDVDTACTCSSRTDPCVHVTAATYAISLIVDQSPTTALAIRGLDLAEAAASTDFPARWMHIESVDAAAFYG